MGAEPFRGLILGISSETQVKDLPVVDFLPKVGMWDNADGRVTTVRDAAHTTTMCESHIFNVSSTVKIVCCHKYLFWDCQTPPFFVCNGSLSAFTRP